MIRIQSVLLVIALAMTQASCTIHHSIGDNFGSYLASPGGQSFKPVGYRWDYTNTALMYVYRPATEWSMDEIETPSFNVNGERQFNIKGGGYTWYELKPGAHDIVIRRGLFGLEGVDWFEIKRIAEITLNAEAGKVYYFRYSEIDPPEINPDLEDNPLGDGPLQLVSPSRALAELADTKMIHRGRGLLAAKKIEKVDIPEVTSDEGVDNQSDALITPDDAQESGQPSRGGQTRPQRQQEEEWWPF